MSFIYDFLFGKEKKIARGSTATIYSPNYACPDFKQRKGYISKMIKKKNKGLYDREIASLKAIKKIDPKQISLASFETTCASSSRKFKYNIISKNFGISLLDKKYEKKSYDHVVNVFLKQTLTALMKLHKAGYYHKDIADRNIVYSKEENRYRLIDFGLATSKKEIDETLKLANIKKEKALGDYLDNIITRGDGAQESFEFDNYNKLQDIYYDDVSKEEAIDSLKGVNMKKLATSMKKAQEDADVYMLLILAPFLIDNKEDQAKLREKLMKMNKGKKNITAKYIYDKLFKKNGGKKKKKSKKIM